MSFLWKICLSTLLIGLQLVAIAVVCRASTATLIKWRLIHYRGEDLLPALKNAGEELRKNPDDARYIAISSVVLSTLVLDAAAVMLWL
ncbi:MAG TPA: hypothetical protein VIM11_01670 [Tepidisphaeraceae bacterium]|jgi:hypothetical protein